MTTAEKAACRARAQTLKPAVNVGKGGVTPALIKELDIALRRAELVKVRFAEGRDVLKAQCDELCLGTRAECVGGLGRVASFYRALPKQERN
ncbi:MAG TPA: YhbY family RNA-binding protein [Opitutales bacterium]|jgi:RNA-binding protein|nr:YhbY family RNA-binding protein [Opitutales bacterium]